MKYVLCLFLVLQVGCSNTLVREDKVEYDIVEEVEDDTIVNYDEDTGVIVIKKKPVVNNVHVCKHKYDESRKFTYVGQVVTYYRVMYGETITTYEYTLPSYELHYLSGDEVSNYVCF